MQRERETFRTLYLMTCVPPMGRYNVTNRGETVLMDTKHPHGNNKNVCKTVNLGKISNQSILYKSILSPIQQHCTDFHKVGGLAGDRI